MNGKDFMYYETKGNREPCFSGKPEPEQKMIKCEMGFIYFKRLKYTKIGKEISNSPQVVEISKRERKKKSELALKG